MTVFSHTREPILSLVAQKLSRTTKKTREMAINFIRVLVVLFGLGCICYAAWMVFVPLGIALIGLTALCTEWWLKQ